MAESRSITSPLMCISGMGCSFKVDVSVRYRLNNELELYEGLTIYSHGKQKQKLYEKTIMNYEPSNLFSATEGNCGNIKCMTLV